MRKILIVAAALSAATALTGCPDRSDSRSQGERQQESVMQRAQAAVPVPRVSNFLTRSAVSKWMTRMDQPNKIFYVYIMGDNGNAVGYYTAQNRPTSTCTLMTPPDREVRVRGQGANPLGAAPALDGVYYGSAKCAGVFFFDAGTDAYIEVNGFHYVVTDQPLKIEADPINVAGAD